ncbi:hypothetical protein ACH5RR_015077 [Cinchona calisaya]|uniref:Uncharacterized protein n=1 Tax=Cinchona calisaya TaxID=153742 RepID=A0ABD2ZXD7_9GENT
MAFSDTFSIDGEDPVTTRASYEGEEVKVNSPDPFGFEADQATPFGRASAIPVPIPILNGNRNPYFVEEDSKGIFSSGGPVLLPPNEMQEEGFVLRECLNAIRLEKKEKQEKETRNQIIQ